MKSNSKKAKKYLLVAAMPTPNGALHLGHVGAQYLPLDIFSRYRKLSGHSVAYYGGFDVFDNAVCVAAEALSRTPEDHSQKVTDQIRNELDFLNIQMNGLINYAEPSKSNAAKLVVEELQETYGDKLVVRSTSFPYSNAGRPMGGNWLRGECSYCQAKVKGYSCDACGRSLLPAELINVVCVDGTPITWQSRDITFVSTTVDAALHYAESLETTGPYLDQIRERLDVQNIQLQWTNIDTWGLPLSGDTKFYNRNFTLVEQLLIGELAKIPLDIHDNAFLKDSEVVSILAYGKDNASLLLTDIPALALLTGRYAPYKIQWISQFYNLDGRKMSTSGNYAIWVREIIERGISSDAVRLYMCRQFDLAQDIDLSIVDVDRAQSFYVGLRNLICQQIDAVSSDEKVSDELTHLLPQLHAQVNLAMQDCRADIGIFPVVIDRWMAAADKHQSPWQWLEGFRELASPALPTLVELIESRLDAKAMIGN